MKKVYIKTLGCEKNTVDSECAAAIFKDCGCILTDNIADADFLMVNTCGFILDAKEQSIESIFDLIREKKENQKLIVSGCLSQRYAKYLEKELPEVDYFLGVDNYYKLNDIVFEKADLRSLVGPCSKTFVDMPRNIKPGYSACIKIAEGCNNVCSYCAIPYMKGKYRSRKEEYILAEAQSLADAGVKELIVIAQDVTYYGQDFKDGSNLPKLLHKLCKIEGIKWIRLMYCYEDEITDELIDCIKTEDKICKYIDIPVQHTSDKILKLMNRKSTNKSIRNTVKKLRKEIPNIIIRTTFITGFPGEIAEDFDNLYNTVNEIEFDRLGCFAYSKEDDTKAAKMHPQVRSDVKKRRKDKIMELQREISLAHNIKLIGNTFEVLVEEEDEPGHYIGRTYMDSPDIDNSVLFSSKDKLEIGSFVKVKINDAFDYDLSGVKVDE